MSSPRVTQDAPVGIAPWVLVGLWGLTAGVVLSHARGPHGGWLLRGAAAVQGAGALYLARSSPTTQLGVLGLSALGLLAGGFAAGGHVWRNSPQLAGRGYWARRVEAFVGESRLRRAHREEPHDARPPG